MEASEEDSFSPGDALTTGCAMVSGSTCISVYCVFTEKENYQLLYVGCMAEMWYSISSLCMTVC